MIQPFNVDVSQHHADTALRRFIVRGLGWGPFAAMVLCLAYVVHDTVTSGLGRLGLVIVTMLVLLVAIYAALITRRRSQMAALLKRLNGAPIAYRFDDDELSAHSALGSSNLRWEVIEKVWIDPDVTMVFYARNGYTTLPTDQIPADALRFLADQVKRGGGTVVDSTVG